MPRLVASRLRLAAAVAALLSIGAAPGPASQEVTFTQSTPLAGDSALAERTLTPLTAARVSERLAVLRAAGRDQPVDLAQERFRIVTPSTAPPPAGYGLLVFIPPWDGDEVPPGWASVLEGRGVVFVSPARAGNAQSTPGRREPLAVLAAADVMATHPIDPERVYVAGFSGGSKVALRLALGYPDLFRGAFLDAGVDPVGDGGPPPPPRALFERFLNGSRLAVFAGADDVAPVAATADMLASLRRLCFARASTRTQMRLGHEPAPASALAWALSELDKPPRPSAADDACRARLDAQVAAALDRVQAALDRGDAGAANRLLADADRRFGGLASPRSAALAKAVASRGAT